MTKKIIGKGHNSGNLYILELEVPTSVASSGVVTPFELHYCFGHHSLSLLKKLYPPFSSLSSLNCESCQYAKFHRVHLSPRVNKQASTPCELIHALVQLCLPLGLNIYLPLWMISLVPLGFI